MEQLFEKPISDEELADFSKHLDPCLDLRDATWARSYLSKDRRRMFCEFEAPDAESVREALRSADITFERVWAAQVFDAADYPEHKEKLERVRDKLAGGP
jgi:hypothetical protein